MFRKGRPYGCLLYAKSGRWQRVAQLASMAKVTTRHDDAKLTGMDGIVAPLSQAPSTERDKCHMARPMPKHTVNTSPNGLGLTALPCSRSAPVPIHSRPNSGDQGDYNRIPLFLGLDGLLI